MFNLYDPYNLVFQVEITKICKLKKTCLYIRNANSLHITCYHDKGSSLTCRTVSEGLRGYILVVLQPDLPFAVCNVKPFLP